MSRIALFTYSTKPRGSVIHTLELATALHRLGHEVCVYALDKDGTGFDYPLPCHYQPIPAQPAPEAIDGLIEQRITEMATFLGKQLSDAAYDYYHAQDCITANALAVVHRQGLIPHYVRTVHHIENYNSPYLRECQDRSIRDPSLCLCVSQYWQQELWQRYQIHAPRAINGVNLDRFSATSDGSEAALQQQLGLGGQPIYLTVGGIEPRKNSIALLQAFTQVLKYYPDAQLVIAGGATLFDYQAYRDRFFALLMDSGIKAGTSLILPGVLPDAAMPALYRTANAFVFPSVQEGWGLVLLEAIASGLPVVTADRPPFTEFLSNRQALLIDPESPAAIAQAMLTVAEPTVARSLCRSSQIILPHYSWEMSAQLHLQHYHSLNCHA